MMDGLLTELKQNSSIWSGTEGSNSAKSPFAPQVPQSFQFFSFSSPRSWEQSEKSFEQELTSSRSLNGFRSKSSKSKTYSYLESQDRTVKMYNHSDSKENYIDFTTEKAFGDISSRRAANSLQVLSDNNSIQTQNRDSYNQFTIIGGQPHQPCYSSSASYSGCQDRFTEDILFQSITWNDAKEANGKSWYFEADKETLVEFDNPPQAPKIQLIQDLVEVNRKNIDFGVQLPGKIVEESLQIINKSDQTLTIETYISCQNPELQDTLEYVYSIRNTSNYDYNERHSFTVGPHSLVSFKVALNVPASKSVSNEIQGQVRVITPNCQGELRVALKCNTIIPKVFCPKQLYSTVLRQNLINLAIESTKTQERKLPIKNDSDVEVTLELSFYTPPGVFANEGCEISITPKVLTIPARGKATVTIVVKPLQQDLKNPVVESPKKKAVQRVLIAKAQNSSVFYSFLLRIETF